MIKNLRSRITSQPFELFLLAALLLFIFSFIAPEKTIDIHLHDTFFVISLTIILWALTVIFFLIWALYKATNKILWSKILTWVHVLVTLFILASLLTIHFWYDKLIPPIKREVISWNTYQEDQQRMMRVVLPLTILFVAGQAAFILNLIGGLIKKLRRAKE